MWPHAQRRSRNPKSLPIESKDGKTWAWTNTRTQALRSNWNSLTEFQQDTRAAKSSNAYNRPKTREDANHHAQSDAYKGSKTRNATEHACGIRAVVSITVGEKL